MLSYLCQVTRMPEIEDPDIEESPIETSEDRPAAERVALGTHRLVERTAMSEFLLEQVARRDLVDGQVDLLIRNEISEGFASDLSKVVEILVCILLADIVVTTIPPEGFGGLAVAQSMIAAATPWLIIGVLAIGASWVLRSWER